MKYLGKIQDSKDLISREFNDHYGVSTTAAATQAKVVTIPSLTELYAGCHIYVKFTNNQAYNGVPTLNVNSLGAKDIRRAGGANTARYEWVANQILHLIYDGTYWVIVDGVGGLPDVTASDNGKVLTVVNGTWAAASLPIYDGTVVST